MGDITAPKSLDGWEGCDTNGYMIIFDSIDGLTIEGPGQLDGQGSIWWPGLEVQVKLFNHLIGFFTLVVNYQCIFC